VEDTPEGIMVDIPEGITVDIPEDMVVGIMDGIDPHPPLLMVDGVSGLPMDLVP
jgi:hypothetical protein